MNKSDSIKEIATALAAAQAEMPPLQLNAINPFLKNKFADLGEVISKSKPVLKKHGLSFVQMPYSDNGRVGVTTIIMHTSGEWIENSIGLDLSDEKGKSAAQVAGSIITYLRRYSLTAAFGLHGEEDNDGEKPQKKSEKVKAPDDGPITVEAWEAWGKLVEKAQSLNVPFDEIKRSETTLGQLRAAYNDLKGFVKDAEEQVSEGPQ